MTDDLLSELEQLSEQETPVSDEGLKAVSELAHYMVKLEDQIAKAETYVKDLKEKLRKVSEVRLPMAMQELKMKDFALENGAKVQCKPFYAAHISEDRAASAHDWLRTNGFGDIIKNKLEVELKMGQDNMALSLEAELQEQGASYIKKEGVHSATLKSFVKEQLEQGHPLPMDLFGVHVGTKAVITRKKA